MIFMNQPVSLFAPESSRAVQSMSRPETALALSGNEVFSDMKNAGEISQTVTPAVD
jgi:hypothetical protein